MNPYIEDHNRKELLSINKWEAFVDHIESIYFQGAPEVLDKSTLAFEYESFNSYHLDTPTLCVVP